MDDTLAQLRQYAEAGTLIADGIDWAGHCADQIEERDSEVARLRAENETLRTALEDVVAVFEGGDLGPSRMDALTAARACLR